MDGLLKIMPTGTAALALANAPAAVDGDDDRADEDDDRASAKNATAMDWCDLWPLPRRRTVS
jgi:hypothetical protein